MADLENTARALVAEGKGILAADESTGTIKKRFDSIGVESTEDNRRAYRELLFTTEGVEEYISGVILFDETIRQSARDGTPFPKLLESKGVIPGIKVDEGAKPLALANGRDGHRRASTGCARGSRSTASSARASRSGARRTRSTRDRPSEYCVWTNAHALARYAALCQEAGIVPIVEPEVLQDGTHSIEQSARATGRALQAVYTELHDQRVDYRGTLLKPNMVLSGYDASDRAGVDEVAEATLEVLYKHVPAGGAGDRVPLRRPDRRGRDRAPERDEQARAASVAALVLVRPRAAGAGAEGVGRQAGERRGGAAGVLPPREDERRRAHGMYAPEMEREAVPA